MSAGARAVNPWHERYRQQAEWTESVRRYFFEQLALPPAARILEVGCGTGAVMQSLHGYAKGEVYGLDIDLEALAFARQNDRNGIYCGGDALRLPFASESFEVVACHFLLLWVREAESALREMVRVCRPGGRVMALAEPDYGGRVDFPPEMAEAGRLQREALQQQGADPLAGRKLAGRLRQAGLENVETGVLGGQWSAQPDRAAWLLEWETLERDLANRVKPEALAAWKSADRRAWESGSRVLYVPTFYGIGTKV